MGGTEARAFQDECRIGMVREVRDGSDLQHGEGSLTALRTRDSPVERAPAKAVREPVKALRGAAEGVDAHSISTPLRDFRGRSGGKLLKLHGSLSPRIPSSRKDPSPSLRRPMPSERRACLFATKPNLL